METVRASSVSTHQGRNQDHPESNSHPTVQLRITMRRSDTILIDVVEKEEFKEEELAMIDSVLNDNSPIFKANQTKRIAPAAPASNSLPPSHHKKKAPEVPGSHNSHSLPPTSPKRNSFNRLSPPPPCNQWCPNAPEV